MISTLINYTVCFRQLELLDTDSQKLDVDDIDLALKTIHKDPFDSKLDYVI